MGKNSKISWTDHTFNPWWGCRKVSPACQNCYAETWAKRTGWDVWGNDTRRLFGEKYWDEPLKWNKEKAFIFCGSMCDVFEDLPELEPIRERLYRLIEATPNLTWLLLSKRKFNDCPDLINIWRGVTVETNDYMTRFYDLQWKGIKFISVEPMLSFISLTRPFPDWVICGGESGTKARPMDPFWARDLLSQCKDNGIPFFFKQWGTHIPKGQTEGMLDGVVYHERPEVL